LPKIAKLFAKKLPKLVEIAKNSDRTQHWPRVRDAITSWPTELSDSTWRTWSDYAPPPPSVGHVQSALLTLAGLPDSCLGTTYQNGKIYQSVPSDHKIYQMAAK
jgi:hypothetical protein